MGIKHFFKWFKKRFADGIYRLQKGETFADMKEEIIMEKGVVIDNFMIDMNGLFHNSAQKIYEYGNCKPRARLLGSRRPPQRMSGLQKQIEVFRDVCATIEKVLKIVKPTKRLILCVDGPAPLSKQNQQRQRRFMSALEKESDLHRTFDSNSITPGTKFMDFLTKYVDWYIRKQMSSSPLWSNIEVIFSNEKAPGEGEHKLINFIRNHGSKDESYCIHGMDADLIMLSLGTHIPKFWILREEPMDSNFEFYVIDIGNVRREMGELMRWDDKDSKRKYDIESAINDFIFMCFTVGNDFLPHIPGIEIIEGGIDFMLDVYKNTCESYGHITKNTSKGVRFRRKSLQAFLGTVSQYEKGVLQDKLLHKDVFFADPLLEENSKVVDGKYDLDIDQYREDYYESNLPEAKEDMEKLCHDYLEGMQWVMTYYTQGVPNWKWRFPHHYAPFAHTIAEHVSTFSFKDYPNTTPTVPFVQLLSVLPPKSADLLPSPLDDLLRSDKSPMSEYCPDEFPVDLAGKRQTWEGTVILPMVDYAKVEGWYLERIMKVNEHDRKRNILGKSFIYSRCAKSFAFHSFYGDFTCNVTTRVIEL